jgi:hypothetical protein
MTDQRLDICAMTTAEIEAHVDAVLKLRARRAQAAWSLVNDPDPAKRETIASIARKIGEPEVRFRKSVETYRDGVPQFKRRTL